MKKRRILGILLASSMLLGMMVGCKKEDSEKKTEADGKTKTEAVTVDGVKYYKENDIKVVSYNIRCVNDADGNSIKERAPRLETVLKKYDPDLIGFQEYVPAWEAAIDPTLNEEYGRVLKYRSESNSEGTPIFYKKSKFNLQDSGYFWFSETPDKESKGWGSDYWRICSWVKLENRQTGAVFYYFNTHFDFTETPQINSAKMLIEKAKGMCNGMPMIVTADYNMTQDSKGYAEMTSYFTDVNMATAMNLDGTFHGYGKESSLIDFCFVTGDTVKPMDYKVMDDKVDDKFVSDHYGIYNEVIILQD